MSKQLGDYAEDYADLNVKFTTVDTGGAPFTLDSGVVSCYKSNGTTQSTVGITLSADFDSLTGLNNVKVDLSSDAFYATGNDYSLVITTGTVDSVSTVGYVIAEFSIENRYIRGTDSASLATALATAQLDLDTLTGADGAIIASGTQTFDMTGDITGNVSGSIGSVTAEVTADMTKINGVAASAANLEQGAFALQRGAATATTLTTTTMSTNLTEATDDHFNGRVITWTSGALDKQSTDITDYTGSTKLLTFTAVTEAPSNTDTFIIS